MEPYHFYHKLPLSNFTSLEIDQRFTSNLKILPMYRYSSMLSSHSPKMYNKFSEFFNKKINPDSGYFYNLLVDTVPTNHYLDKVSRNSVNYSLAYKSSIADKTFYPNAVRWTDGSHCFLIERPPFKSEVTFKPSRSNSYREASKHTMWFPWTVMFIYADPSQSIYSAFLYLNDGPITSLDDTLINPFYFNLYQDSRMCLNQSYTMLQQHLAETGSFDISNIYNFLINDYMTGGWNLDLAIPSPPPKSNIAKILSACRSPKWCYENGLVKRKPKTLSYSVNNMYKMYMQYLSALSLDQVLNLVTDYKQNITSSQSRRELKVSEIIESNKVTSSNGYMFPDSITQHISNEYDRGIHLSYMMVFTPSAMVNLRKQVANTNTSPDLFINKEIVIPSYQLIQQDQSSAYDSLINNEYFYHHYSTDPTDKALIVDFVESNNSYTVNIISIDDIPVDSILLNENSLARH